MSNLSHKKFSSGVFIFSQSWSGKLLKQNTHSIFQAADGCSSTSESSLGSSSGYGSQSTVRPEDQHNLHQPTLTAVHDGMKTFLFLPLIFIFFM